jgi:DNA-binding NtrC family response regulator
MKIFILDDMKSVDSIFEIAGMIKADWYRISIFRTYDSAIERMKKETCAILLIDHDLGEKRTGCDFIKEMWSTPEINQPYDIIPISMNPVGQRNLGNIIQEWKRYHRKEK